MKKLNVISRDETIDYIIKNNCSIARVGNGELDIIMGDSKGFQQYDKNLAKNLMSVRTNEKLLLCVPYLLENKKCRKAQNNNFYSHNRSLYLYYWRKYFNVNSLLGDASLTRFYIDSKNQNYAYINSYVNKLKLLWENRNIIFVEGYYTKLGVGNDLFDNALSRKRILCPNVNAYDKLNEIEKYIYENIKINDNYLFIIALGPTATILSSHLSLNGYQALDVGHVDIEYEWFLRGAKTKITIPNKYVNEVLGGNIGDNVFTTDKLFKEQVIHIIK